MKNIKIHTKLTIGYIVIGLILVSCLYFGYTTAAQIITVEDQEHYLRSYAYFTMVEFIVMVVMVSGISIVLTRTIRKNFDILTKAARLMLSLISGRMTSLVP